jgi:hypothetical protein
MSQSITTQTEKLPQTAVNDSQKFEKQLRDKHEKLSFLLMFDPWVNDLFEYVE